MAFIVYKDRGNLVENSELREIILLLCPKKNYEKKLQFIPACLLSPTIFHRAGTMENSAFAVFKGFPNESC